MGDTVLVHGVDDRGAVGVILGQIRKGTLVVHITAQRDSLTGGLAIGVQVDGSAIIGLRANPNLLHEDIDSCSVGDGHGPIDNFVRYASSFNGDRLRGTLGIVVGNVYRLRPVILRVKSNGRFLIVNRYGCGNHVFSARIRSRNDNVCRTCIGCLIATRRGSFLHAVLMVRIEIDERVGPSVAFIQLGCCSSRRSILVQLDCCGILAFSKPFFVNCNLGLLVTVGICNIVLLIALCNCSGNCPSGNGSFSILLCFNEGIILRHRI